MVYTISAYIGETKAILPSKRSLPSTKAEIADRMALLCQRDDLMQVDVDLGPADAAAGRSCSGSSGRCSE